MLLPSRWLCLAVLSLITVLGGCDCGGTPPVDTEDDAGAIPGEDAGVEVDAGADVDAGVEADAGVETDAGVEFDAGTETDAGMETDAGTITDGGVTPATLCQDVATKRCDYWIRCRTDSDANPPRNQGRVNDQWVASERTSCELLEEASCQALAASWDKGRAVVSETAYLDCVGASYPAATCDRDLEQLIQKCEGTPFLTAAQPTGGLCVADFECSTGFCSVPTGDTCGTCAAPVANGQPCTRDAQCATASWCATGYTGAPNTCQAKKNVGDTCSGFFPTFPDQQCGSGNVCARTGTITFTCQAGKALGATCGGNRFECQRNLVGQLDLLCSTATNNANGTCVKGIAPSGGTCGTGELQGPFCPETEFCAAGLCLPRRAAGVACQGDAQCQYGLHCVTNVCTAYKDVGQPCANSDECKNPLTCQGATCQPILATVGEACNASVFCVDSYCDASTNLCSALKANGQACAGAGECASTACVSNVCAAACWQ